MNQHLIEELLASWPCAAVFRIFAAALLGGAIGWERERHGRAAGLRTHTLLALGCALIMLVSLHIPAIFARHSAGSVIRVDPGRIAGHALSGLGFLGAGAIIVLGKKIRGLTTAASIWVSAAIGLAIGAGYLIPAFVTWLLAMFALLVVHDLEARMEKKDRYVSLSLGFSSPGRRQGEIVELLEGFGFNVLNCRPNRRADEMVYELVLRYQREIDFEDVTAALSAALRHEAIERVEWSS